MRFSLTCLICSVSRAKLPTHFRSRRRFQPALESLDQRIAPATDIRLTALTANGQNILTVNYNIANQASAEFNLGVYQSADAVFGAGDTAVANLPINDPADLTVGNHVKFFVLGDQPGQTPFPGAGAIDSALDYFLLGVADDANAVVEQDATPFAEDNTAVFTGVYHLDGGPVMVQGGSAVDTITAAAGVKDLVVNGKSFAYDDALITEFRIRTHNGNDSVTGTTCLKPMFVWGGLGNDTIIGGKVADYLNGGIGNDGLSGLGGADTLDGGDGTNTLTGGGGADTWAILGSATNDVIQVTAATRIGTRLAGGVTKQRDTFTDLSATLDRALITGAAGNDVIKMIGALACKIQGDAGNDNLTGGSKADTLDGGAGNDKLFGMEGNDTLNGGADNDTVDGGIGLDTLFASAGIDTLKPGAEANAVNLASLNDNGNPSVFMIVNLSFPNLTGAGQGVTGKGTGQAQLVGTMDGNDFFSGNLTLSGAGSATGKLQGQNVNGTFTVNGTGTATGTLTQLTYQANLTGTAKGTAGIFPFSIPFNGTETGTVDLAATTGNVAFAQNVPNFGTIDIGGSVVVTSIITVA